MTTAMLEDAASILAVCRDQLVDGVSAVFTRRIGHANDEFLAMADRAGSLEQQHLYFAATQFLSNRSPQLLQQFRSAFIDSFTKILNDASGVGAKHGLELPSELSLVDDDDFEQDLAITKLTARAAFNCSQQLVPLDRRLAHLMRVPRMMQEENPLYPGVIFEAMLDALERMGVDPKLALTLLQSFERQVGGELSTLYAEINRYLAQAGVLPTMSLKEAHEEQAAVQSGGRAGGGYAGVGAPALDALGGGGGMGAGIPAGAPFGYGVGGGVAAGSGQDVFGQLLQAIQAAGGPQHQTVGWPPGGSGMMPGSPQGLTMAPQSFSSGQLVQALGSLQRGQVDPSLLPGLGSIQIDPYAGNALRQLRATPMASWSHPMDAMTMDIVAMLFDAMFDDPDLPASVRAEISKLQIPVLKVALLDKKFFSDRKHPARRLLDAIAHSGIGRSDADEPRLLEKISEVVEAVVEGFESDVSIFESQLEVLKSFLEEEESAAPEVAATVTDELEARERKELAPSRASAEVEKRLSRRSLPSLIGDFLTRSWRLVLVDVFARSGASSEEWRIALKHMDDLVWSVAAKTSSQERDRLVVLLPAMLKGLREGLERVDLQDRWNGFFSELIQLHVAALHKDSPPELYPQGARDKSPPARRLESPTLTPEPEPSAEVSEPTMKTSDIAAALGGFGEEDSEEVFEAPGADPSPTAPPTAAAAQSEPAARHEDDYMGLVQRLEVGAWVEFQSERGTRNTLRLNWVSEFRRVFLFTNRQGENAMTLAASSLADHLRKGTARLLSQNPLTDRAVAHVLERVVPAEPSGGSAEGSRPRGYAWE